MGLRGRAGILEVGGGELALCSYKVPSSPPPARLMALAALVPPPEPKPEYLRPAALSNPLLHAAPGSFLPARGAWGHWDRDRIGDDVVSPVSVTFGHPLAEAKPPFQL